MSNQNTTPKIFQEIAARVRREDGYVEPVKPVNSTPEIFKTASDKVRQEDLQAAINNVWDNWDTMFQSGTL